MLAWGYVIHFLRTIIMSNSLLGPSLQNMTEFVKQNKQTNHIYYKIPFHKTGWSWERVRRSGFNPPPPFIRPVGYFNYFPATKILPTTGSHAIVRCEQKKSLIALKNVLGRRVNKISWISGFKLGLPPPPPPFPTSPCQKFQDLPLRRLKWRSVIFSPVHLHRTRLTSPISAIHGMLVSCVPT